jgi:peroxin-19
MESLMRELGGGSLSERADGEYHLKGELDDEDDEAGRRLKAAWEAMLVDGMDGMVQGSSQDVKETGGTSMGGTNSGDRDPSNPFQDQIRQAMDKLRESESNLQVLASVNCQSNFY